MAESECIRETPWSVKIRVIKQKGSCVVGHEVDDEIFITDSGVEGKICISLLYSVLPKVYAMMYNARFPWLQNQCKATHACPDAHNPLVVELTRIDSD
ncbi:MAG: TIGR04076 family protein [Candidatus Lokiarchaeota archaeon]|nr:TIGR04076 family protein [Candidatus Lokiarchaeota archaeon]